MNEIKLKSCPFCGGRADVWSWNGGTRIDCENWSNEDELTHCVGVGARTEAEAIEAWNRRVEHDDLIEACITTITGVINVITAPSFIEILEREIKKSINSEGKQDE